MPLLARMALVVVAAYTSGCGALLSGIVARDADAPSFFSQVTAGGIRYAHNWPERPCFSVDLAGTAWRFEESTPDGVSWRRGEQVLRIYLTDNRQSRFAVRNMDVEEILRAFMAYELEYVQPWFEFQISHTPRLAEDFNGIWMQWGWEGHGGKRRAARVDEPADQRHVIHSLWVDPWVLSLDWATTDLSEETGATPAKIDALESLTFRPDCWQALPAGETWAEASGQTTAGGTSSVGSTAGSRAVRRGR